MIRDSRLERIGKLIYQTWDERPDPPVWAKGGLKALGYEVAEEIIDLQSSCLRNNSRKSCRKESIQSN